MGKMGFAINDNFIFIGIGFTNSTKSFWMAVIF
jgi:hypothetical protein